MGALVYDCDDTIKKAVDDLRSQGAELSEIRAALLRQADEIFNITYDNDY